MLKLTCIFFLVVIMMATQDIAVDGMQKEGRRALGDEKDGIREGIITIFIGWALTMLPKSKLGYASTCQVF